MALTDKQRLFIAEYLVDLNATQAAIRAGYSEANARIVASQNLSKLNIQEAIKAELAERFLKVRIDAERVLGELALIAFADPADLLAFDAGGLSLRDPSSIPIAARRAIASVKVKRYMEGNGDAAREVELTEFRYWNKNEALANLAKHLGLLKDRIEHTGPGGGPIQVKDVFSRIAEYTDLFRDAAAHGRELPESLLPGHSRGESMDSPRTNGPPSSVPNEAGN